MDTVTIYKVSALDHMDGERESEYYSLEPGESSRRHACTTVERSDDGGKVYALPDDGATWELAEGGDGLKHIYRNGEYVEIVTHDKSGKPQLCGYSLHEMPVLALAS
jgi:hypothetical protein